MQWNSQVLVMVNGCCCIVLRWPWSAAVVVAPTNVRCPCVAVVVVCLEALVVVSLGLLLFSLDSVAKTYLT